MAGPVLENIELSIVMPCLNEAETLQACIDKAFRYMDSHQICGEVVIGDNGSTDNSQEIAERCGARVIHIPQRGYGNALRGAIMAAKGKYVIAGDSDDSYDFDNLTPFIEKLRGGYDMVIGNRFKGEIKPGAMPFLHKYLGNPILSFVGRWFTKTNIGDFHCGLRGIKKSSFENINFQSTGMEFATEMIVKASIAQLKITEVPTTLFVDGRSGPSHIRTWSDGWRHLRFLLNYSPKYISFINTTLKWFERTNNGFGETTNTPLIENIEEINSKVEV